MRPEVASHLHDVLTACRHIQDFVRGKTFRDYAADALLRSGVERQFEIVGEALNQARGVEPQLESRVTDMRRIVAFRNRLIHGYATVDDAVVWGVIEANPDGLVEEIATLLDELPPPD